MDIDQILCLPGCLAILHLMTMVKSSVIKTKYIGPMLVTTDHHKFVKDNTPLKSWSITWNCTGTVSQCQPSIERLERQKKKLAPKSK